MNKFLLLGFLVGAAFRGSSQTNLPAFPGAEGFGRFASGGRGGAVYHVTNLHDSGPGSFRDGVSQSHRTVVFDVGGLIKISRGIAVAPNITIAGQSAPGEGIGIYGNSVSFSGANNSIARHIRFRMGVNGDKGKDAAGIAHGHDLIFDHVSVSWGRDENFSINGPATNITIQNCIIAQGLQHHSAGGLIQTRGGVSILKTLYIDNFTRNPKVKGVNQYVNNVVYNWGGGGCYILGDSESESFANVMNNYFISGPNSSTEALIRGNTNFHLYAANNFYDSNRNGILDGTLLSRQDYGVVGWQEKPYTYPTVTLLSPGQAFQAVLAEAGASLYRDSADRYVVSELLSLGKLGQIITNENLSLLSGSNEIASGSTLPDIDQDGMPDVWENVMGLNPLDGKDGNQVAASGYTQLEEYLNWLAEPHAMATAGRSFDANLNSFTNSASGARLEIVSAEHCVASLQPDGLTARVVPADDFVGRASFRFALHQPDSVTNAFGLLFFKTENGRPPVLKTASAFNEAAH